jgi:hypothetical protein
MRSSFASTSTRWVIAAIAAALGPHPLAGRSGKQLYRLRCDGRTLSIYRALGPLSVGMGLIADGFQLGDAVLQRQVREIGHAIFNGVVESHPETKTSSPRPAATPSGGRLQIGTMAGFNLERVAGFRLECVAGFVGIRSQIQIRPRDAQLEPGHPRRFFEISGSHAPNGDIPAYVKRHIAMHSRRLDAS